MNIIESVDRHNGTANSRKRPSELLALRPNRSAWINRRPCRQRKVLPRFKRRERLTSDQWMQDWYRSLVKLGYQCRNQGVNPNRQRVTTRGLKHEPAIYMQKGDHGVFLYASATLLPATGAMDCAGANGPLPTQAYRIVQGRRPDTSRGVQRFAGTTATGIVRDIDVQGKASFYVDFDGALFEFKHEGKWQEARTGYPSDLYAGYRQVSAHHQSIRPYYKPSKYDEDFEEMCLLAERSNILGFEEQPCYRMSTKLL